MLLTANVGNTNVRLAGFGEGDDPVYVHVASIEALDTLDLPEGDVEALVLSSVNPMVGSQVRLWADERLGCPVYALRVELPLPIAVDCAAPHRIGADRLANAIALHHRTGRGGIVVDCGTATSFSVVSPDGRFLGGAIAPGLTMSARALHTDTALLPLVDPARTAPGAGCDTEEAIAAGLLWGLGGMIDRLVEKLREPFPDAPVVATGGSARHLVPHCRLVETILPHLTLQGLRVAYLAHVVV
ncbi:type III pantothenate kinase [bacterium]|nr:type III pantothenate kinase [bacterium]